MEWTGLGCDVCGFGTVEDIDKFNPRKPCPECGAVMVPEEEETKKVIKHVIGRIKIKKN